MTVKEYERLCDEAMEIANELERCRTCIQEIEWEFDNASSQGGSKDGAMGLHYMRAVMGKFHYYDFWQGESAEVFADKLQELYDEFVGAKDDIVAGLRKIENRLGNKFEQKEREVNAALNELKSMQRLGKATKDYVVDTFKSLIF